MQSSITQHREAVAGRASRVKLMGWWRCKHWQPRWVGLFVDASVTSNNIQNFTAMHVYLRRCQSGSDAADKVGLCCHPFRRSWPWQSWPWQSWPWRPDLDSPDLDSLKVGELISHGGLSVTDSGRLPWTAVTTAVLRPTCIGCHLQLKTGAFCWSSVLVTAYHCSPPD